MSSTNSSNVFAGLKPIVDRSEMDRLHYELIEAVNRAHARWLAREISESDYKQAIRNLNRFSVGLPPDGGPLKGLE